MAVDIVFETHSLSEDNERGIATGWFDGLLSARGRVLARELGLRRRKDGISVVFTSDLGRAIETANIAFAGTGITIIEDARLRECDYGDWNGMLVKHLEAERGQHIEVAYPGGESYRRVVERMGSFLTDLVRDWDGSRVLLIGHSATRWTLDYWLAGKTLEELIDAPFGWREGWSYALPADWSPSGSARCT